VYFLKKNYLLYSSKTALNVHITSHMKTLYLLIGGKKYENKLKRKNFIATN
jgi:hypothetical protein